MSYVKSIFNYNLLNVADSYIEKGEKETNSFKKGVLTRICYLALAPCSAIASTADTVIGAGAGLAAIATGGMRSSIYNRAMAYLNNSQHIVAMPYAGLLQALNPEARFSYSMSKDGIITHYVHRALKNVGRSFYNSDSFIKKHVAARLTYALLAISSVVTRAIDGIIGLIAGTLSFISFGQVDSINDLAYRSLKIPGIVKDLFYCFIKFANPTAGTTRMINHL